MNENIIYSLHFFWKNIPFRELCLGIIHHIYSRAATNLPQYIQAGSSYVLDKLSQHLPGELPSTQSNKNSQIASETVPDIIVS
jgi:hypothetical protein